jgi:hypothetical protein
VGSGYTLQGGISEIFIEPRYFVFGPATDAENNDASKGNSGADEASNNKSSSSTTATPVDVSSIQGNVPPKTQDDLSGRPCDEVISDQYDVVLNDAVMQNSADTKKALNALSEKVTSAGAEVVDAFEDIGILVIKSSKPQLLVNVLDELKTDPNVEAISPSQCVKINPDNNTV